MKKTMRIGVVMLFAVLFYIYLSGLAQLEGHAVETLRQSRSYFLLSQGSVVARVPVG